MHRTDIQRLKSQVDRLWDRGDGKKAAATNLAMARFNHTDGHDDLTGEITKNEDDIFDVVEHFGNVRDDHHFTRYVLDHPGLYFKASRVDKLQNELRDQANVRYLDDDAQIGDGTDDYMDTEAVHRTAEQLYRLSLADGVVYDKRSDAPIDKTTLMRIIDELAARED